jgi:NAD-dependent DNA ligase
MLNYGDIEKNPQSFYNSSSVDEIVDFIKKTKAAYYNTAAPLVSDLTFDIIYDMFKEDYPNHPIISYTGAIVKSKKVKLPFEMYSLNKIKPDQGNLLSYVSKFDGPYIISDKLDGISIGLDYYNGLKLYTRGDGKQGQDITQIMNHISLPKYLGRLQVRGELIIKSQYKSELEKSFFNDGKGFNLRNFVSGLVNSKIISDNIKVADIVCYEVIEPLMKPSDQLDLLKHIGFNVVPYEKVERISVEILSGVLKERKRSSKYDIDGLVVYQDSINKRLSSNPDYAFAFKETDNDSILESEVVKVEWNISKDGYLKPRIQIKPVLDPSGVVIKYATGFNAKFIYDNGIGKGAVINLVRSGAVIPHITKIIKSVSPDMPDHDWKWNETGVDAIIVDHSTSSQLTIKKLTYFFETLKVENVKEGVVSKLVINGYDDIFKIIDLDIMDLSILPGFNVVSASKIIGNIRARLDVVDLDVLMAASGIFGRNFSKKRMESILEKFPNIFYEDPKTILNKVLTVDGFSNTLATQVASNMKEFVEFYEKIYGKKIEIVKFSNKMSSQLDGVSFVFTGFRDTKLEEFIKLHGGEIKSTISRGVSYLVVKDVNSSSSKTKKAKEYGIRIVEGREIYQMVEM